MTIPVGGKADFADGADDSRIDGQIGILLRVGTYSSAAVILLGGVLYLIAHGGERPDYSHFHGVPPQLMNPRDIVIGAFHRHPLAVIQLGLLMLIATPIARVMFSIAAFFYEKDYLYTWVSIVVLCVLAYSLIFH